MKWPSSRVSRSCLVSIHTSPATPRSRVSLQVGRSKVWIGSEAQPIALARGAGSHPFKAVDKRVWQQCKQAVDALCVLLLALVAMLLQLGVIGQRVQAVQLGAVGLGAERLAIDGDQARNAAVHGLDDLLGCVVALVGPMNEIADRPMALAGVEPVLHGAAHQGRGIDRHGRQALRRQHRCGRNGER
jgi:hypothetical protein